MATPTTLPSSFSTGAVLTAAQMNDLRGAFRILQVVQGTYASQITSSSTTFADTGLTASITPSATSSNVLILVNQSGCYKGSGNAANAITCKLLRGSTDITTFAFSALYTNSALQNRGNLFCAYLDSPGTTSSTTYKTQFRNDSATADVGVQVGNASTSTIILMEVSA
jgi:hypothetical protein